MDASTPELAEDVLLGHAVKRQMCKQGDKFNWIKSLPLLPFLQKRTGDVSLLSFTLHAYLGDRIFISKTFEIAHQSFNIVTPRIIEYLKLEESFHHSITDENNGVIIKKVVEN